MGDVEWQAQADQYARIAARYVSAHRDVLCTRTYDDYWNECLFRLLPNSTGTAAFLDPMCGAGNLLEKAAASFRAVVGADVSRHMLAHVPPELRRRVTLLCSDVTRLYRRRGPGSGRPRPALEPYPHGRPPARLPSGRHSPSRAREDPVPVLHRLNLGRIRTEENALWSFAPHDIHVILRILGEEPAEIA